MLRRCYKTGNARQSPGVSGCRRLVATISSPTVSCDWKYISVAQRWRVDAPVTIANIMVKVPATVCLVKFFFTYGRHDGYRLLLDLTYIIPHWQSRSYTPAPHGSALVSLAWWRSGTASALNSKHELLLRTQKFACSNQAQVNLRSNFFSEFLTFHS